MYTVDPIGRSFSHLAQLAEAGEYFVDSWQRSLLFIDTLRQRGNNYLEHLRKGQPPVLTFPYTVIMDGRDLKRPVNYALVRIQGQRKSGPPPTKGHTERRRDPGKAQVEEDPAKRPIIIIDPRAGHGPGIGGSKQDSQVGNALAEGHPVYFVIFYTEPMAGQTLPDVHEAIGKFIEEVNTRHPQAQEPMVIGNCQAGWASALIGAERPELTGPLVLNGAPLSFWSSIEGKNPLSYRAGLSGGAWIVSFLSDLGHGRFDGANLVANFEDLNPANTLWSKQYSLYSKLDTEVERFLTFEQWWSGFYLLTDAEIHFIVDSLFVGNKLEKGSLELTPGRRINLRNIEEPVLIFSSQGDNITPPHQAMNWIRQVYGSVEELIRQRRVLVYMVHDKIGHLGIFVSKSVAQKEHQQILEHADLIQYLPPGLYEMVIEEGDEVLGLNDYKVRFEERTLDDFYKSGEYVHRPRSFQTVAAVSRMNDDIYRSVFRPWVRLFSNEISAEMMRQFHPLRMQRYLLSDLNPFLAPVKLTAPYIKSNRQPASDRNTFQILEQETARMVESTLDLYREIRDRTQECFFKAIFENPMVQDYFLGPQETPGQYPQEECKPQESMECPLHEFDWWLARMNQGGFVEAAVRCLVAVISTNRLISSEELELLKKIVDGHERFRRVDADELREIIQDQAYLLRLDEARALQALESMLPSREDREEIVAVAQELAESDKKLSAEEKHLVQKITHILNL